MLINLCIMGNFLSQSSISIELLMEVAIQEHRSLPPASSDHPLLPHLFFFV